jgi:hypothetical protein
MERGVDLGIDLTRRVACPQPPNPSPIRRQTLGRPGSRVFFFACKSEICFRAQALTGKMSIRPVLAPLDHITEPPSPMIDPDRRDPRSALDASEAQDGIVPVAESRTNHDYVVGILIRSPIGQRARDRDRERVEYYPTCILYAQLRLT